MGWDQGKTVALGNSVTTAVIGSSQSRKRIRFTLVASNVTGAASQIAALLGNLQLSGVGDLAAVAGIHSSGGPVEFDGAMAKKEWHAIAEGTNIALLSVQEDLGHPIDEEL